MFNSIFLIFLLGRILFGGYFIYSGIGHFTGLSGLTGYARMKGVPFPKAATIVSGVLVILGGLSVLIGYKMVIGMWAIVLFLLPTTFLMHKFWTVSDPQARMADRINFTKNIGLIGALFLLISIAFLLS